MTKPLIAQGFLKIHFSIFCIIFPIQISPDEIHQCLSGSFIPRLSPESTGNVPFTHTPDKHPIPFEA
jgi:hypothetical protein